MRYTHKAGFSLFELSVVLLVMGLFAGGFVAGANLLEMSKINKTIKSITELGSATLLFETQYGQSPGDFNNASNIWPSCIDDGLYNPCNGDNNEGIESIEGYGPTDTNERETLRALQHLSLAGLIDGSYTGVKSAEGGYKIGENTMGTGIETVAIVPIGDLKIWAGGLTAADSFIQGASFTSTQSYIIDTKIDDGVARTGNFKSSKGVFLDLVALIGYEIVGCLTVSNQYDLSTKNVSCRSELIMRDDY